MSQEFDCPTCQNRVRKAWDGTCPECRHREIGARLAVGMTVTVRDDAPVRHRGMAVTVLELHRNDDGRFNGIARVRPVRVVTGHHCGAPVYRDGTDADVYDVGTRVLVAG